MRNRLAAIIAGIGLLGGLVYVFWPSSDYCASAVHKYGMKVPVCPTGVPRQIVSVYGRELVRGGDGEVSVSVRVKYTTAKADEVQSHPLKKFKVELFIVNAAGEETPLPNQNKKWESVEETKSASVKLPALDDGQGVPIRGYGVMLLAAATAGGMHLPTLFQDGDNQLQAQLGVLAWRESMGLGDDFVPHNGWAGQAGFSTSGNALSVQSGL